LLIDSSGDRLLHHLLLLQLRRLDGECCGGTLACGYVQGRLVSGQVNTSRRGDAGQWRVEGRREPRCDRQRPQPATGTGALALNPKSGRRDHRRH